MCNVLLISQWCTAVCKGVLSTRGHAVEQRARCSESIAVQTFSCAGQHMTQSWQYTLRQTSAVTGK